ncbi:hypothetical protein [Clostridium botulinum]|uniref:hypothetical protein n=1 Tax=Clostridium botulinum TaxID=1491 RepID=UPI00016B9FAD|nr:hypothetical protein [Clostridium botulinum]
MFNLKIIDSARFLKMPSSTRLLYYDLCMRADDDGVVEGFNVLRMTGATEDDLRVLTSKGFIQVLNEDLVSYIIDWTEHNKIRADRKVDSIYKDLLLKVIPNVPLLEAKARADRKKSGTSQGQPTDDLGKDRIGKDKLDKDRLGKDKLRIDWNKILTSWNSLPKPIKPIRSVTKQRKDKIKARINSLKLNEEDVLKAIGNIKSSSFCQGNNNRNWIIEFDWLFQDDTRFTKVFENKYVDKEGKNGYTENNTGNKEQYDFSNY